MRHWDLGAASRRQYSYVGGVPVVTSVVCTTCTHNSFTGSYAEARLFARDGKFTSLGFDVKYYMLKDTKDLTMYSGVPPQHWLTADVTFTFGI